MNENENLVPKRRFKEFTNTGTWEQRKLGDIADIKDSARISNELWVENGIPYLRSSDLVNGELNGELFISKETYEGYASKTGAPQKDDVLFTSGGKVGVVYHKKDESPVYVQGGAVLYVKTSTSNLLDGSFLSIYFGSPRMQTYMDIASSGGTIKHFTLKPANASPIIFPGLSEQQKIGAFFKELDKTIALHQRKLEKSKALKSAYLSEMFPAEGERKPKRRFAGFTDDWEQRKLIDVAEMFDNLRIPVTASDRVEGNTAYYGANGIQDYVDGFTHDGEFVLIAEDGANDLINYPVNYVKGKIWVNNHAHVVSGKKSELDNLFLTARIKSMNISHWLVGGGRAKLNGDVLKKIPLTLPIYEEQKKIGAFFKQLDDAIALHQHKLEKLQNIKQAYLNELFV